VEIRNKKIYINGKLLDELHAYYNQEVVYPAPHFFPNSENYQKSWEEGKFAQMIGGTVRDNFGPVKVPQGYYLVLGDNRDSSFDSRFWGPLADKYLKGRALFLYWPIKRIKIIK
ncbi:MAG TPA: signal peptidase I, partial [Elusimicrobia bacterium]|nr:signal peptidase I [Elusimicrobiota bacterium]